MKSNKKQVIRLTESDLHRIVKESVKKVLNEGKKNRVNRPLSDYIDDVRNKWMSAENRKDPDRNKWWEKYKGTERAERVHALRNNEYPTASYQGEEYTIDDPLPENARVYVHYTGASYANNAYPEAGESLRDWVEGCGDSIEDITDWWLD